LCGTVSGSGIYGNGTLSGDSVSIPILLYDSLGPGAAKASGDRFYLDVFYPGGGVSFCDTLTGDSARIAAGTLHNGMTAYSVSYPVSTLDGITCNGTYSYIAWYVDTSETVAYRRTSYRGTFTVFTTFSLATVLDSLLKGNVNVVSASDNAIEDNDIASITVGSVAGSVNVGSVTAGAFDSTDFATSFWQAHFRPDFTNATGVFDSSRVNVNVFGKMFRYSLLNWGDSTNQKLFGTLCAVGLDTAGFATWHEYDTSMQNNIDSITSRIISGKVLSSADSTKVRQAVTQALTTYGVSTLVESNNIGINWADITNPTSTVGLSGTTVGIVSAATVSGTPNVNVASFTDNAITYAAFNGTDPTGWWNVGKTGYSLTTAPLDSSQTARAVWGAPTANHAVTGSFGLMNGNFATQDELVDANWNELQSGHTTTGTFGKYLDAMISSIATGSTDTTSIKAMMNNNRFADSGRVQRISDAQLTLLASPDTITHYLTSYGVSTLTSSNNIGINWANITNPTSTVALTNTTISGSATTDTTSIKTMLVNNRYADSGVVQRITDGIAIGSTDTTAIKAMFANGGVVANLRQMLIGATYDNGTTGALYIRNATGPAIYARSDYAGTEGAALWLRGRAGAHALYASTDSVGGVSGPTIFITAPDSAAAIYAANLSIDSTGGDAARFVAEGGGRAMYLVSGSSYDSAWWVTHPNYALELEGSAYFHGRDDRDEGAFLGIGVGTANTFALQSISGATIRLSKNDGTPGPLDVAVNITGGNITGQYDMIMNGDTVATLEDLATSHGAGSWLTPDISSLALQSEVANLNGWNPATDSVNVDGSAFAVMDWAKKMYVFLGWGEIGGLPVWSRNRPNANVDTLFVGYHLSGSAIDTVAAQMLWHVGGAAGDPPDSTTSVLW
jgi:hypothetical protein